MDGEAAEIDPTKSHVVAQWPHDRPLIACRFDPGGAFVFCGSEDNIVERFQLADGTKTLLTGGHATWAKTLAFTSDGQLTISGGYDGKLTWWETAAAAPQPIRTIAAHGTQWIRCLEVAAATNVLASCGNDNAVRLWRADDGTLIRELTAHEKHVYSHTFDAAGNVLYSGDLGGTIREWNVADGAEVRSFDAKELWSYNSGQRVDFGGVRALACSPDGRWLAAGGLFKATNPLGAVHEPLVLLINLETGTVEKKLVAEGITQGVVWRLRWLVDGSLSAVCGGGNGGFLLFWKPDAEKDYFRFKLPNIARDMDLHPDGLRVATAHHDKHVRITMLAAADS